MDTMETRCTGSSGDDDANQTGRVAGRNGRRVVMRGGGEISSTEISMQPVLEISPPPLITTRAFARRDRGLSSPPRRLRSFYEQ